MYNKKEDPVALRFKVHPTLVLGEVIFTKTWYWFAGYDFRIRRSSGRAMPLLLLHLEIRWAQEV